MVMVTRPSKAYSKYGAEMNQTTTNDLVFYSLFSTTTSTEAGVRNIDSRKFIVTRVRANVFQNDKDEDTIVGIRSNGENIGSLTIGSGTGAFDSGAIHGEHNPGDPISLFCDTSASSSGSFRTISTYIEGYYT